MSLQGHSAPLGITFYEWKDPADRPAACSPDVAFPKSMNGYAFMAYHGSWNRDVPTGYKVVYVEMDEYGDPIGEYPYDLLKHEPPDARWDDGFRPVDVSFDDCGRLLISSDGSRGDGYAGSKIVRMENTAPPPTATPTNSASPSISPSISPSLSPSVQFPRKSDQGDNNKNLGSSLSASVSVMPRWLSTIVGVTVSLWLTFGG
ncbi:Inherit from COG: Dehydrogenase [Seminavis robusta]|uniref:Inherit from COG: Dehydrogenase n=1 Tax=Seminavis robusta TaxID=568900 RepID=A0A9N8HSF4_9STRA|nr:Inherit from COG: Dehydrogenase [Seminavis robusta]|eukprot:Sro1437_g272620.1 Inherit from COG: Dehydrogenase (203) ;mRNA; r:28707-29315